MQLTLVCGQREDFQQRYRSALQAYKLAVGDLNADLAKEHFESAHRAVDNAHRRFVAAREQLRQHIETHGCKSS